MQRNNEFSLGEAIEAFLEKNGIKEESLVQGVIQNWEKVMGKAVAENTERIWFRDGVFFIKMSNPVWRNELNMGRSLIVKRINAEVERELVKEVRIL